MKKYRKKYQLLLGVIFYLCFTASNVWSKSGVDLVEIKLLNDLDDKRGFCIDIKGYKFRAKIKIVVITILIIIDI